MNGDGAMMTLPYGFRLENDDEPRPEAMRNEIHLLLRQILDLEARIRELEDEGPTERRPRHTK